MSVKRLESRVDRFAGLSDRSVPVALTRIENPDLLNVDFYRRDMRRRNGYTRVTTEPLKDSSVLLDGFDDFVRFDYIAAYDTTQSGTSWFSLSLACKLKRFPAAEVYLLSRGNGTTGADRIFSITYDPTINSNNGGWRLRLRDTNGAGADRAVTINDGDAALSQVGALRHLRVYPSDTGTGQYTFEVHDGTASVGTATFTWLGVTGSATNTRPFYLGVSATDVNDTIPSEGDSIYGNFAVAEFKIGTSSASATLDFHAVRTRELYDDPSASEVANLASYWKLNEGNGGEFEDLAGGNDASTAATGGVWITDPTQVIGQSALQFFGERGHIQIDATNLATHLFADSAGGGAGSYRSWTISFLFVPKLAQGETTVRDQVLLWTGSSSNPEPLTVSVVSDRLEVKYADSTTVHTLSPTLTLSSIVNERTRVFISLAPTNASGLSPAVVSVTMFPEQSYASLPLVPYPGAASSPGVTGNPTTISVNWSMARRLTNFSFPPQFPPITSSAEKTAYCVLDDVAVWKNYATTVVGAVAPSSFLGSVPTGSIWSSQYSTMTTLPGLPAVALVFGLPMEEGSGSVLQTTGSRDTSAFLYPQEALPHVWDAGLVEPATPPEITLLTDYRNLGPKSDSKTSILAISGTTLYKINPDTGAAEVVDGNLPKGGKWTSKQYGNRVFLASKNGHRPVVFDGDTVTQVGIVAPASQASVTPGTIGGGSLALGTYHLYVTFRNSSSGAESNPSPAAQFTLTGTQNAISQVTVPTSPDPQVNQRRIWLTTAGGGAGSQATLVATIDDNTTITYTTGIASRPATPILEYVDNDVPPVASVVWTQFDALFVAGNHEFPTRVWYSDPGRLESFNQVTKFLDADLDSGDPVIGLRSLRDQLIVYLRDGRVGITATGDPNFPYNLFRLNQDVGAVSQHATLTFENRHFFLGERDFYLWDGNDAFNLSSPPDVTRPSIKRFIRETLNDDKKSNASMALYRAKDQVWLSVARGSSERNDAVLVLDASQGTWSVYEMDMDVIAEIEDDNDEPSLYGASWGHIVKLDQGNTDGLSSTAGMSGTLTSATTLTLTDSTASWTENALKGLYVHIYLKATDTVLRARVARNSATVLYLASALGGTPQPGDLFIIGGIPWHADFLFDFGNPMQLKRAKWVKLAGMLDGSTGTTLRVSVSADKVRDDWNYSGVSELTAAWESGEVLKDLFVGGFGRTFRLRLSSTGYSSAKSEDPFPDYSDPVGLVDFRMEAEEVAAR